MPRGPRSILPDLGLPERVVLAGIRDPDDRPASASAGSVSSPDDSMEELARLAQTMDYEPCAIVTQVRDAPDPATHLGKGKVAELRDTVNREEASRVIVDGILTPTQARNLEESLGVSVTDRAELILSIFAARAHTSEGKLQVELARLRHNLARLAGFGVEMSNPGAGLGTRGPGERKIEADRRVLRKRIARLNKDLRKVDAVRSEQRRKRRESGIPIVSLVGYTNAGKSTLFNALTGEEAYADDKLFATLDPWTRRWTLPSGQATLLVDTVGFIQGLPHELVAAFRATLEESVDADVLVHVVDISNPSWPKQMAVVGGVLSDLGVSSRPRVICFNKVDRLPSHEIRDILGLHPVSLGVSALGETGLPDLAAAVSRELAEKRRLVTWSVPYSKWEIAFEIRRAGVLLEERHGNDGAVITCELTPENIARFSRKLGTQPIFSRAGGPSV